MQPSADVALYLERHGADVIMGAVGHTRFREIVSGVVTRTVLETVTLPVLMSR